MYFMIVSRHHRRKRVIFFQYIVSQGCTRHDRIVKYFIPQFFINDVQLLTVILSTDVSTTIQSKSTSFVWTKCTRLLNKLQTLLRSARLHFKFLIRIMNTTIQVTKIVFEKPKTVFNDKLRTYEYVITDEKRFLMKNYK